MRKTLFLISTFIISVSVLAIDPYACNTADGTEQFSAMDWELKEVCLNPYQTICQHEDSQAKELKRASQYFVPHFRQAAKNVYERNKFKLNAMAVTEINFSNYKNILIHTSNKCEDDQLNECHSDMIDEPIERPHDRGFFANYIEDEVIDEYFKLVNQELDDRKDVLQEAYKMIQKDLVEIMRKQLKGRVPKAKLDKVNKSLLNIKAIFSSSDKMVSDFSSQLDNSEKELLKNHIKNNCFDGVTPIRNAYIFKNQLQSKPTYYAVFCPGDYMGTLNGAMTLKDVYRKMAIVMAHELGHYIHHALGDKVYKDYIKCFQQYHSPELQVGDKNNYNSESISDFWAKQVVIKILSDLKDKPMHDRLLFLKESANIFCGSENEGIHQGARARILHSVRMSRAFNKAFRCTDYRHVKEPVDCQLKGPHFFMIPNL